MRTLKSLLLAAGIILAMQSCKKVPVNWDKISKTLDGKLPQAETEAITKVNTNMTFYPDCIKTLDVQGFGEKPNGVKDFRSKPTHTFLFLVAATVRDAGESAFNAVSPTADIGLLTSSPKTLKPVFGGRRLFGPYYEGIDSDDKSFKYEWLDKCSMRYNNFAIADLTEHPLPKIRVFAQEGDDLNIPFFYHSTDDLIFDFDISIDEIKRGNNVFTGKCDISGQCATFCFALGSYAENSNCGTFWSKDLPNVIKPKPGKYDAWFNAGKETVNYIFNKAADFILRFPYINHLSKKWVVISYRDGYCIFNHIRSNRTMQDVINTATGKGGDCDWWPWPEGSKHVCLDTQKNAEALIKKHGKIINIGWIDHPTKYCGN